MNTFEYIMKKYNLIQGSNYFLEIPNMGRDNMAELFAELGFNYGAEIGVERGQYSEVLCKANPKLQLICIDPWSKDAYIPGISGVDSEQYKFDGYFEETKQRLASYNVKIVRATSLKAASDIPDNSLDFVYIDANHDFVNFTNDIDTWKKKVKMGGIVSGHDYAYFSYKKFNHVKRALEAYSRCYRMNPYFVVGAMEYKEGTIRDKYRSWFWVKDK